MDILLIEDLNVKTIIGTLPWEREVEQTILLNIKFAFDNKKAASQDHLEDTIDYSQVAEQVTAFANNSQYELIETLAENIAALILKEYPTQWVQIHLTKPGAIHNAKQISVCIERS